MPDSHAGPVRIRAKYLAFRFERMSFRSVRMLGIRPNYLDAGACSMPLRTRSDNSPMEKSDSSFFVLLD